MLIGVDLDEDILNEAAVELYPDASDFLYKLDYPLRVKLFAGDIIQYDRRLEGTDAVVAIELYGNLLIVFKTYSPPQFLHFSNCLSFYQN